MSLLKKKYAFAAIYSLLLTSFTVYVALDTFVTSRVYAVVSNNTSDTADTTAENATATDSQSGDTAAVNGSSESENDASSPFTDTVVTTDNSYSDKNISITVSQYNEYSTDIYVADIYVSSPEYLKTAFAKDTYGKNIAETTSEIASSNDAILAINGDFYGTHDDGYVIKNGELYRDVMADNRDDLVIWADGSFDIVSEDTTTASQLLADGAENLLSFGPGLLVDGAISVARNEEVKKSKTSNPRTAIGIVDDLHYVFVVADGRTDESSGLTLFQLASFMMDLGVQTAYNLDGGGSTTMYFNGDVINNPTTDGQAIKERRVSDIVYIGY